MTTALGRIADGGVVLGGLLLAIWIRTLVGGQLDLDRGVGCGVIGLNSSSSRLQGSNFGGFGIVVPFGLVCGLDLPFDHEGPIETTVEVCNPR